MLLHAYFVLTKHCRRSPW